MRLQNLSVPSPGQCGGKTKKLALFLAATLAFQYPLRVNVVEKPRLDAMQIHVLDHFQYPLRVNVVEKPSGLPMTS